MDYTEEQMKRYHSQEALDKAKALTEEDKDLHHATQVLLNGAEAIVKHKMCLALGIPSEMDISQINPKEHEKIWAVLVPMMQALSKRQTIEVTSAGDVIKAVTQGKMTFAEAKELMLLFKAEAETKAIEKGTANGSINVLLDMSRHVKGKD